MLVLGLQGSPRMHGNTSFLCSVLLDEAEKRGVRTKRIDAARVAISGCVACGTCEKEGFCPVDDDMQSTYPLLKEADLIVLATPVFFYGATAQLKSLIDRCQAFWARRYVHGLVDPKCSSRQGVLVSVGATRGKNLFDGIVLTAQYFFDAVGAAMQGRLTYRRIEAAGEIKSHPSAETDARRFIQDWVSRRRDRKKLIFLGPENSGWSQIAAAFAQYHGGGRVEVQSAGVDAAPEIRPEVVELMGEKGLDMAFRAPQSLERAMQIVDPDLIVSLGCDVPRTARNPEVAFEAWELGAERVGVDALSARQIRDDIERRVKQLVGGR